MQEELSKISSILEGVNAIALEDGSITKDEKAIIEMIEKDLREYKSILELELKNSDEEVEPVERMRLKEYKERIFEHARNIAADDGRFYEDEWHILEKLHELVE